MKVISWNIRAGGGRRSEGIVRQLKSWNPDVICLSEFRGTEPSQLIARSLHAAGWDHQRQTSLADDPARNALLVASRWPLRRKPRRQAIGDSSIDAVRWLQVSVLAPRALSLLTVHVPNRVTGRKTRFLGAITDFASTWSGADALIVGDTNTGRIQIDEESPAFNQAEDQWMRDMESLQWRDGFRALHADRREFTWYSPNGRNGFRLDQAFLNPDLLARTRKIRHRWGGAGRRIATSLSDHAALIIDLD